ncbi:MAG: glycosyltransferase [bacterium]|nr:glycosyltransferase [bacterium]
MLKKLLQVKMVKFLLGGGASASINLLLMFGLIEGLGFSTPALRNTANAVSVELSLLASFFIYRIWVWPGGAWTVREVLWRQIPLYHMSAGSAVILRIFVVFPLYDWLGVHYALNTLIGILLSASINYVISDRLIFKAPGRSSQRAFDPTIHYPEGLSPALENSFVIPSSLATENPPEINLFSIVIPAYNEEACIEATIQSISQVLQAQEIVYEILVINDNSRDHTEACLQRICQQNSKVRYLNNEYPRGFGFAVRCGLAHFRGDAVAIVMADSSDAPEDIVDYYTKLRQGYDCVFGSRFMRGGKVIDYPTHKLIVNRLANLFIQFLFGLKFNDITNAFKAYRREVIEGISPLLAHHFNLTVEMPLKAIIRGYSYAIIPITWRNRTTGVSKLKLKEMGSRYLFIVLYAWIEKHLSRGDYAFKSPVLGQAAGDCIKTIQATPLNADYSPKASSKSH